MKRFFTKKRKLNIAISFLLFAIIATMLYANIRYNQTHYAVEFYRMNTKDVSQKVRMVFVTDLHLREYGKENQELLSDIQNLTPDMILLGGDLVIDEESGYENMISFCSELAKLAPSYGVWGNHEDIKMYLQKDENLRTAFEGTGVKFLTNETASVEIQNHTFHICGVDGNASNFESSGAKAVMEAFDKMTDGYKICLAHVPVYFTQKLENYDFDLGFAGHTHGGIVNIPKIGALYSQEEGFLPQYAEGIHELGNHAKLIISRGLGDSGKAIRINNVPELTVVDLN